MIILPEEILDRLNCDTCHNTLSVGPVKVYPKGVMKCGRCSQSNDNGVFSKYGIIAEHAVFECVNRYNGCRKLLTYAQVSDHESSCHGKQHICPLCPETIELTTLCLVRHFIKEHGSCFLTVPSFKVSVIAPTVRPFVYKESNNLFCILCDCRSRDKISLSTYSLGDCKDAAKFKLKFTLRYNGRASQVVTKVKALEYFEYSEYVDKDEFVLEKPEVAVVWVDFELLGVGNGMFSSPALFLEDKNRQSESDSHRNTPPGADNENRIALPRMLALDSVFQRYYSEYFVSPNSAVLKFTRKVSVTIMPYCHNCSRPLPGATDYMNIQANVYQPICDVCNNHYMKLAPHMLFQQFPNDTQQNLHVSFSCIWRMSGCKYFCKYEQILRHESICPFQPKRACPVLSCTLQMELHRLEEHFKVAHPVYRISLEPTFSAAPYQTERWYVWVQFNFLVVDVSRIPQPGKVAAIWCVNCVRNEVRTSDSSMEPQVLTYFRNTGLVYLSSADSGEYRFMSPERKGEFICYFEANRLQHHLKV